MKGFQRGLELFGQHRVAEERFHRHTGEIGLLVVPGPAGDEAAAAALPMLAADTLVRLARSRKMGNGAPRERTVDGLKAEEWQKIATALRPDMSGEGG